MSEKEKRLLALHRSCSISNAAFFEGGKDGLIRTCPVYSSVTFPTDALRAPTLEHHPC